MGGFFELRDPSLPGGAASSGPSRRVVIVDGSEELARWLLGLATPPPGVLFLRGRDASVRQEDRSSCAVGASYLPIAGDITLGEWVARAAKAADWRAILKRSFRRSAELIGASLLFAAMIALGVTTRNGTTGGLNRRATFIENDGTIFDAIGTYLTGSYNNAAVRHPTARRAAPPPRSS